MPNLKENVQRASGGCKFGHWFHMTRSQDNLASALAGEQMALGEREGKKWGQADYRTPISPTVPRSMSGSLCVPALMASVARGPCLGPAFWENRCEITSLPPSVIITASARQQARSALCRQQRTLGILIAVTFPCAQVSVLLASGHAPARTIIRISGN